MSKSTITETFRINSTDLTVHYTIDGDGEIDLISVNSRPIIPPYLKNLVIGAIAESIEVG